ncbi:MAG: rod shape-determining protein MreC [Candidatus Margulisiibacteriota bacterium]|nr:rod shape-determining protein MreC [Candidatus Margulisiibacteriota bacterium]
MRVKSIAIFLLLAVVLNFSPVRNSKFVDIARSLTQMVFYPLTFSVHSISGGIYGFGANIFRLSGVEKENRLLRERLEQSNARVNTLLGVVSENKQLRNTLEFAGVKYDHKLVPAEVVNREANFWESFVTINKGISSGISAGDTVMSEDGLVGRVEKTLNNSSTVRLITDGKSRVSCYLPRAQVFGVLEGGHGRKLKLSFIPEDVLIEKGDEVLVSSYSERFKRNVGVGRISSVKKRLDDMFQDISVAPETNFSRLSTVYILVD